MGTGLGGCLSRAPNSAHLSPRKDIPASLPLPALGTGAGSQGGQNRFEILILIFGSFQWQRHPLPGDLRSWLLPYLPGF